MDITEIIERLKRIAGHAVHTVGERPFVMSLDDGIAVYEAIELLEKADNVEAIPVPWIEKYIADCGIDGTATMLSAKAVNTMLEVWKGEQK